MIAIVVDRPRYGLLEHAAALRHYLIGAGYEATVYADESLTPEPEDQVRPFRWHALFAPRIKTVVIWSVGLSYGLIPLLRLMGKRVIVVIHEPGGYAQRIARGDPEDYARKTTRYESLTRLASVRGTPREDKATGGLVCLPLLLQERRPSMPDKPKTSLVLMGRRDPRRNRRLFLDMRNAKAGGLTYREFPNPRAFTTTDKDRVLSHAIAVLNLYKVPHNQSGVTVDCIRYGVPVIVSDLDAWADRIAREGLGVVIPVDEISEGSILTAVDHLRQPDPDRDARMRRAFAAEFGQEAFDRHWRPLF